MSTWDCAPKNSRVFQAVDVAPPGLRPAGSKTVHDGQPPRSSRAYSSLRSLRTCSPAHLEAGGAASTTVLAAHAAGSREDDAAPANVAILDLEGYSLAAWAGGDVVRRDKATHSQFWDPMRLSD